MRSVAGLSGRLELETIACDFCGSDDVVPVVRQTDKVHRTTDELFTIVRCAACGLH